MTQLQKSILLGIIGGISASLVIYKVDMQSK